MHALAMSSTEHNLWTIANIGGIVVVRDIDVCNIRGECDNWMC